jgi:phenylalanyl-tRNA synthetase beta chain
VHPHELDFFDAKGIVEQLLETLRITKVKFKPADPERYGWLQPGRAAELMTRDGQVLGWVGNIHPRALKAFGIDDAVVAFELPVARLLKLATDQLPFQDIPTLPGVAVDLAIVVDESVTAEVMVQRLTSAGGKLLTSVHLADIYRDEQRVGAGKKSMTWNLVYRAADHTLTSDEVEKAHNKLVTKVCKSTGGEVRA